MLLSFERRIIVGAFVFVIAGAMLLLLIGLEQAVLPESKNMSKRALGSQRTWEVVSSPRKKTRMGIPGDQPRARRSAFGGGGRYESSRMLPWYCQAKATKRGETGGRKSQRLDSTVEAGELAAEDPVEESEASAGRLNRGKHAEHIEVP